MPANDQMPEQAPADPGAVSAQMEGMRARADEAIALAVASSGPLDARHRLGIFEVTGAMRPKFGPANAWLYGEREQKLRALAKALGVDEPIPEGVDLNSWDLFFDAVDSSKAALEDRQLSVKAGRTDSAVLGFAPRTPGRALRVEDLSRLGSRPVAPVPPAHTLHFIPPFPLSAHLNLGGREQPGTLVGALEGALVFSRGLARLGEPDDGRVENLALEALFGDRPPEEDPASAKAAGATRATRHRGVLRLDVPPGGSTSGLALPEGTHAALVTQLSGADAALRIEPASRSR